MMTPRDDDLQRALDKQVERRRRHRPGGPIGLIVVGGTVGLLFVVPLVIGAYLGRWLDSLFAGYSVRWTVSLIILGIAIGSYGVIRFLKGLD
jgi:ATP synthase protein I